MQSSLIMQWQISVFCGTEQEIPHLFSGEAYQSRVVQLVVYLHNNRLYYIGFFCLDFPLILFWSLF